MRWDRARKNVDYELIVEGEDISRTGSTDEDGELTEKLPLSVTSVHLLLGPLQEEIELQLGNLDPLDAVSGWQARLSNLGHDAGPVDASPVRCRKRHCGNSRTRGASTPRA